MPRIVICDDCGQQAEHYAHGICKKCYMQTYRERPGKRKRHAEIERNRRAKDPEAYREYERKRSQTKKRKEWTRRYNYRYYRENRDRLKRYAIEYRQADTTRQTIYKQRRRNRVKGLESTLTPDEWQQILEQQSYSCFYCGATGVDLEMEHKNPASRGGGYTKKNIVAACGPCNRSKKTMTVAEYQDFLDSVS